MFQYNGTDQKDLTGGNVSLGGRTGIMLTEFIRYMQCFMDILPMSNDEEYQRERTSYDFGANLVSNIIYARHSPLITSARSCIVLPYERMVEIQLIYHTVNGEYSLAVFSVFYGCAMMIINRLAHPHMPWHALLFRGFSAILGGTFTNRIFREMQYSERVLVICIQLYSVIISGIFSSVLATAFTTGLRYPDIVDTTRFLATDLRIMIHNPEMLEIFKRSQMPKELSDRLIIVDKDTHNRHLYSLNDSFAYVVDENEWPLINFIQERLYKPKLKLGSDVFCGNHRFLRLPIHPSLSYSDFLTDFVSQIQGAGLLDFWTKCGLYQAQQAGLVHQAPHKSRPQYPLPLQYFKNCFIFYGSGMLISLVALILELVFKYWRSRQNNLSNVIVI